MKKIFFATFLVLITVAFLFGISVDFREKPESKTLSLEECMGIGEYDLLISDSANTQAYMVLKNNKRDGVLVVTHITPSPPDTVPYSKVLNRRVVPQEDSKEYGKYFQEHYEREEL